MSPSAVAPSSAPLTPLDNVASLPHVLPEGALVAGVLALLVWDLVARGRVRAWGAALLALTSLAFSAGRLATELVHDAPAALLFGGQLASDPYATTFRLFFAAVTFVVVLAAVPSAEARDDLRPTDPSMARSGGRVAGAGVEYLALLLVVSLGMNLLAMARSLLMIYVALEIVSVLSFVLAGYKLNDRRGAEASLKYVVFGGVSSGVMLYGMSWLYGLTGSLALADVASAVATRTHDAGHLPAVLVVAVTCVLAGFAYKISAVPFHMWTPDVYEGSPTPVTAFLSVGPKAAGFAVLVRFFHQALGAGAASQAPHGTPWPLVAGVLAALTMTAGNVSALAQPNVKRMLAFSSIAHAGYMLLAFSLFDDAGVAALVFYVVTYAAMNLGAFVVIQAVADSNGGDEDLVAFRGLGARAPALAAAMTIFLFSLVGLPPFAGFVGKLYVFLALLASEGPYHGWYLFLAVLGVVNTVVSLFYYARVLRVMYLDHRSAAGTPAAAEEPRMHLPVRRWYGVLAGVLVVPTLVLGVYWGPVYDLVARSLTMTP